MADFLRRVDRLAVKRVVVSAVVELLLDPAADLETQVGRDRHVAGVEKAMDIAPQQEPVRGLVLAAIAVGANMPRFQRRQRPLARDRAPSAVDIRDQHPESALSKAGTD